MLQNPISGRGHCPPRSGQAGVPARQGGGCWDQGDHPQPHRRLPHPRWRRPQRVLQILRRPHHSHLQWNCAGNAVNITFLHTSDLGLIIFFLQWTVFKNPINITTYQLNQFRSLLTHEKENLGKHEIVNFYGGFHQCCTFPVNNFRPAQPVNGRAVQLITTSSPRWCSVYHPSASNRSNLCF